MSKKFHDLGGEILVPNVEDHRENYTRFLLLSTTPSEVSEGAMKTTVLFRTPNTPGSLTATLWQQVAGGEQRQPRVPLPVVAPDPRW